MTIKDRLAGFFYGDKIKQINQIKEQFIRSYEVLPAALQRPDVMMQVMKEMDPHTLEVLIRQSQSITGFPGVLDEGARIATVQESRFMYTYDVITQNAIDLWTDYGFGSRLEIQSKDPAAQVALDDFFHAEKNQCVLGQREVSDLSKQVLTDGEFFYVFYISKGKTPTVRVIPTEQIKKIITDPDDASVPLLYKREWATVDGKQSTLYYRDWRVGGDDRAALDKILAKDTSINDLRAEIQAKNAATENAEAKGHKVKEDEASAFATDIFMMHIAHRKQSGRGWPLMTAGIPWSKAYKNFLQDRASIARTVAMIVDDYTVKGGSTAVEAMRRQMDSSNTSGSGGYETNPKPVAGSSLFKNEAVDFSRRPLTTGAGDAETDGAMLLRQAGQAARMPPHYFGAGEAFRLATATAMEQPVLRAFNRYRRFWDSVWQDVATVIFRADGREFKDTSIIVVSDPLVQNDVAQISAFTTSVVELYDRQAITPEQIVGVGMALLGAGLKAVGVTDAGTILEPTPPKENVKTRKAKVIEAQAIDPKFHKAFRKAIAETIKEE